jgi:thiamine biosynthesis lipoprotein
MHRTGAAAASPMQGNWRVAIPPTLSPAALFRPHGEVHALEGAAMGTSWHVRFVGPAAAVPALRRAIIQILDRVVAHFSPWEAGSELNRFNATTPGAWHAASPDFAKVLGSALRIAEQSGGACDPALGGLVDLWGFGPVPRGPDIPAPSAVEQALETSGWRHIDHDRLDQKFARRGFVRLDLCGIAKGHAVDLVTRALREGGIAAALVEIGGELSGYGIKPDGTPWWVAVDGEVAGEEPLRVALHGIAIATSGSERCFAHAGKSYSHTIDPHTGRPIDNGMISATVLHESCMQADAYATALLAMGPNAAIAFAERHSLAALIRYRVHATDAIMERVSASLQAMLDD